MKIKEYTVINSESRLKVLKNLSSDSKKNYHVSDFEDDRYHIEYDNNKLRVFIIDDEDSDYEMFGVEFSFDKNGSLKYKVSPTFEAGNLALGWDYPTYLKDQVETYFDGGTLKKSKFKIKTSKDETSENQENIIRKLSSLMKSEKNSGFKDEIASFIRDHVAKLKNNKKSSAAILAYKNTPSLNHYIENIDTYKEIANKYKYDSFESNPLVKKIRTIDLVLDILKKSSNSSQLEKAISDLFKNKGSQLDRGVLAKFLIEDKNLNIDEKIVELNQAVLRGTVGELIKSAQKDRFKIQLEHERVVFEVNLIEEGQDKLGAGLSNKIIRKVFLDNLKTVRKKGHKGDEVKLDQFQVYNSSDRFDKSELGVLKETLDVSIGGVPDKRIVTNKTKTTTTKTTTTKTKTKTTSSKTNTSTTTNSKNENDKSEVYKRSMNSIGYNPVGVSNNINQPIKDVMGKLEVEFTDNGKKDLSHFYGELQDKIRKSDKDLKDYDLKADSKNFAHRYGFDSKEGRHHVMLIMSKLWDALLSGDPAKIANAEKIRERLIAKKMKTDYKSVLDDTKYGSKLSAFGRGRGSVNNFMREFHSLIVSGESSVENRKALQTFFENNGPTKLMIHPVAERGFREQHIQRLGVMSNAWINGSAFYNLFVENNDNNVDAIVSRFKKMLESGTVDTLGSFKGTFVSDTPVIVAGNFNPASNNLQGYFKGIEFTTTKEKYVDKYGSTRERKKEIPIIDLAKSNPQFKQLVDIAFPVRDDMPKEEKEKVQKRRDDFLKDYVTLRKEAQDDPTATNKNKDDQKNYKFDLNKAMFALGRVIKDEIFTKHENMVTGKVKYSSVESHKIQARFDAIRNLSKSMAEQDPSLKIFDDRNYFPIIPDTELKVAVIDFMRNMKVAQNKFKNNQQHLLGFKYENTLKARRDDILRNLYGNKIFGDSVPRTNSSWT